MGVVMSKQGTTNIGKITDFYNGKAHEDCIDDNGQYILINSRFVSTSGTVVKKSLEQRFPLVIGDIAMVMSDVPNGKALARCFLIKEDKKYTLNQRICCFRSREALSDFLYYVLDRNKFYLSFDSGVTQTNLRKEEVLECPIYLPPLPEQKAIANILQTWDTAIEKTEALIAAKERQFGWLVTYLISNQFENPNWNRTTIGSIGEISSAGVDKKILDGERSVRLVNYLDVYHRDLIFSENLNHTVTAPSNKINKCSVQKGDIFFTPSSEIRGDFGHSAVAMENISDAVYSYHIIRLRPSIDIDLLYSAYAFRVCSFYKQISRFADGSGQRYVVSQNNFRKIKVALPPLPEQKRIAHTLNTAKQEIDTLKKLVDKYRTQKRGLMQKLLTGKWRVKTND